MALTTPTITVGGKVLRKGDRFSDTKNIKWVDNRQSMQVKALSTGTLYEFSRKVFESKGNALSIADYFLKTNKASTRGESTKPMFTQSPNSNLYPEKRIALVIGNSNYDYLPFLRNAQKDASDIAETLLGLGFDVMETYECTYPTMKTALNNFSAKARDNDYDVALFYYAGHGKQEKGQNYLVPIERELEFISELNSCLNCEDVLQRMEEAKVPIKLVYLDACRDTKASWSRSSDKGLAKMEGPIGSVIVFSTQSGSVASDGEGPDSRNSPFAASMLKNIISENVSFNEVMTRVVRDTYSLTKNVQYPLQIGTLITDFSFNTPKNQPAAAASVQKQTAEEQYKIGNDYYNKEDYHQALVWLRKAAELGHSDAQNHLGYMYDYGLGVDKNYVEAVRWYRKSAEQGNSYAQRNLGYMYCDGLGVEKSYTEAVKWYKMAAEQG
ncbi:MAG: caspase family protein, partial [Muribaculaceae bacterium]|nr:caspase family protein [Muribaculaceae bacterium]